MSLAHPSNNISATWKGSQVCEDITQKSRKHADMVVLRIYGCMALFRIDGCVVVFSFLQLKHRFQKTLLGMSDMKMLGFQ